MASYLHQLILFTGFAKATVGTSKSPDKEALITNYSPLVSMWLVAGIYALKTSGLVTPQNRTDVTPRQLSKNTLTMSPQHYKNI